MRDGGEAIPHKSKQANRKETPLWAWVRVKGRGGVYRQQSRKGYIHAWKPE
jgi:hypothetical protein